MCASRFDMKIALAWFVVGVVAVGASACVYYSDRCEGVSCAEGTICLDLEQGPRCVCDSEHETVGNTCVAIDDGGE